MVQFHPHVEEDVVVREREGDEENQPLPSPHPSIPKILNNPQQKDRSLPLMPSEMWMDCASALCVNWTTISPETARATFAGDASSMCLDISLQGVCSEDGLCDFHMKGLVQIVVLFQTITIMMMTDTTITIENNNWSFIVETEGERREFLFMGVNPKKVWLADVKKGVEERMKKGWQLGVSQGSTMAEVETEQEELGDEGGQ
uniref:Uncharacterized protein n=1 Tax=Moniliophthora roreri TaxID=221103 RepID=A0A0W0G1R1_MONRR